MFWVRRGSTPAAYMLFLLRRLEYTKSLILEELVKSDSETRNLTIYIYDNRKEWREYKFINNLSI